CRLYGRVARSELTAVYVVLPFSIIVGHFAEAVRTRYGLTSPHSCRDENHGNGGIFEYCGCRVAQEQPLAWPAAHAHHDQVAAIALGLGENGLALRAAFYDRPDLLIVLAGKLDDVVENRPFIPASQHLTPPALAPSCLGI